MFLTGVAGSFYRAIETPLGGETLYYPLGGNDDRAGITFGRGEGFPGIGGSIARASRALPSFFQRRPRLLDWNAAQNSMDEIDVRDIF